MKKTYEVKRDFWVGDCNIQLKEGDEVQYDQDTHALFVEEEKYEARNLKAAIKATWLVPVDGKYPDLDGPLGESEEEATDRRRKERFAKKAENVQEVVGLVKDEREVGVIKEDSDLFEKILNVEPVASEKYKNKKKFAVIEDDTHEVGVAIINDPDSKALKKSLNQGEKVSKDPKEFKVYTDHYDAESLHVGKYKSNNNETTLKTWSQLHWTKKAEVIKTAEDKTFLTQLKGLETSKKIQERITKKLEAL
ncbi:hypothetical protein N9948_01555 [bacterium]|nr:hypothetical protein [bacterium]